MMRTSHPFIPHRMRHYKNFVCPRKSAIGRVWTGKILRSAVNQLTNWNDGAGACGEKTFGHIADMIESQL